MFLLGSQLKRIEQAGDLWESIASLIAVGLVSTFVFWMVEHDNEIKQYVEEKTAIHLSKLGIFFISLILFAREGAELAVFSFAGQYTVFSIFIGFMGALVLASAIYFSLLRVNLSLIFNITLIYLIFQVGFLLGNGIHEGLSVLNALGYIKDSNILMVQFFDLSKTVFSHETGWVGIPLNILLGWNSSPEWIVFMIQYVFTFSIFGLYLGRNIGKGGF